MSVNEPIGKAVLYVSSNVAADVYEAFSVWCNTIHHFDTMRIDGFLSLRRFELVAGSTAPGTPEFGLLTLYQVESPECAAFDTPAYARHTATYTPPPPGVTDGITYERTIYQRTTAPTSSTQPVGQACVSLTGRSGPWLDAAMKRTADLPGVLNSYAVTADDRTQDRVALLVDVDDVASGRDALAALTDLDHGGQRQAAQLFEQVFPSDGILVRDRRFVTQQAGA
jgi:hypothetical protein